VWVYGCIGVCVVWVYWCMRVWVYVCMGVWCGLVRPRPNVHRSFHRIPSILIRLLVGDRDRGDTNSLALVVNAGACDPPLHEG